MGLKRFDGWEHEMWESENGEFVRLEDAVKLLEAHPCESPAAHPYECICDGLWAAIALIKGEQ